MTDFKRLQGRLKTDIKWMKDPPTGITASCEDDDITVWKATISGPVDSPWEGGTFKLALRFPPDYPFKPPKVRFVSRMFHPNIYSDGSICLDFLQDNWTPAYHVPQILVSIQSLLCDPNPNSPVNSDAARMFIENRREYNLKIREIVEQSFITDTLHRGSGSTYTSVLLDYLQTDVDEFLPRWEAMADGVVVTRTAGADYIQPLEAIKTDEKDVLNNPVHATSSLL